MMKLSKKEKILCVVALLTFLGFGLSTVGSFLPLAKSFDFKKEFQLKKKMIEYAIKLKSQREDIEREAQKYSNYIKPAGSEEEETASFVKEIESIAQESSIHLADIKPFSVKKETLYAEYRVEIETETQISDLMRFFYKIQNSQSLLRVTKFRLSLKADDPALLKASLTVTKIFIL